MIKKTFKSDLQAHRKAYKPLSEAFRKLKVISIWTIVFSGNSNIFTNLINFEYGRMENRVRSHLTKEKKNEN